MSLLDRLFPRRTNDESPQTLNAVGQVRRVTGIKMYSETPGVLWGRPTSSAGVQVDEFEALTIAAVFAACTRLANIAAMLPIGVYQKSGNGKREEQHSNPAGRLLAIEANPSQTAFVARHFMQFWKPLFGAACAEIGWDGAGRPQRLWPLEPWRVDPKHDENDQLYFRVDGRRNVAAEDMIYVPHVTEDGICGKGFIHYALESLGNAIAADQSAGRFFQNDMKPGGILQHDGNPPKEARAEMRGEWQRHHGGVENRGKTGVLWGGWKWINAAGGIPPDDAQLLETRQYSVLEVARWFNVPPHWLAELGRATWGNVESESIEALKYAVGPMIIGYEQEFDRKLFAPPRIYCKYNVNALLRGDMKSRSEFYRTMKEIGVYTTNQILGYEDENGIGSEGDQRFVPVNWQPADDLATGGEAQRKAAEARAPVAMPASDPVPSGSQPVVKPPASQSKPRLSVGMQAALKAVAEHALNGLAKKEINEARRAVKKPNDVTKWMEDFYGSFIGLMAEGLTPTATLVQAQKGEDAEFYLKPSAVAAIWAESWTRESRVQILAAMECRSEEWPNRSAAMLQSWESRATECAARIANGVDANE